MLTHMFSAVQFLQMLDASSLSISKEDYEAGIKTCKEEVRTWGGKGGKLNGIPRGATNPPPLPLPIPTGGEEEGGGVGKAR